MSEQRKAVIKNADMSEQMQQDAVDVASVALSKYNIEKVIQHSLSCALFSLFSSTYALRRTFDSMMSFPGRGGLH